MLFDRAEWARTARDKANIRHILKKEQRTKNKSFGAARQRARGLKGEQRSGLLLFDPTVSWQMGIGLHFLKINRTAVKGQTGYNSAHVFQWKPSRTIWVEGCDKTPTCTYTSS